MKNDLPLTRTQSTVANGTACAAGISGVASLTTAAPESLVNAMTIDVEDYFQVSAFENSISRDNWLAFEQRVEASTDRILSMLDEHSTKGTFFTLAWVAERYPELIRRIVDNGHELASHGCNHTRVTELSPESFCADVRRSKRVLEDIGGQQVKGYRAPTYSINKANDWAHDILADEGYLYSSSIAPIKHDLYGIPDAPRFAHRRGDSGLLEIPVSTVRLGGKNYPCAGGGWFRLYPYELSAWAMRRVNRKDAQSCVFYFHPWEIDAAQPRMSGLCAKTRLRHYLNLAKMQPRVEKLLKNFVWGRMDDIYL
ncbi:MAG: XrtA system polysaccharide deacetylase [Granulosicoccus sp.]